jgi:hypothetical protein
VWNKRNPGVSIAKSARKRPSAQGKGKRHRAQAQIHQPLTKSSPSLFSINSPYLHTHPHPRILENHSFNHNPSYLSFALICFLLHNHSDCLQSKLNRTRRATSASIMEHQQNPPPPQHGGVAGPSGRRLHIAHRRSPSELTPLMSMFSTPGSKFITRLLLAVVIGSY